MNQTLVMATLIIIAIIYAICAIYFVISRKSKRIKASLAELEIEKNKLDSSPIIPELAKVETLLKNEKVATMYETWTKRLKNIKEEQIPRLTDMILEAEYSLSQKDYKNAIYKIAKLEMEIYKVRTDSEFLLGEIKEITKSEERSRVTITDFKVRFRELHQKFQDARNEFGAVGPAVMNEFEMISKRFEDYETIMDNKDYPEVNGLLKNIDELLKHMAIVVDEVPSILLLGKSVIPKKIEEVEEVYNQMVKADYPLDYLNVEYNIDEANKKINDILVRTQKLNLEDSLFELKVLLDYFESLFSDFDREKEARANYAEVNNTFKVKLDKINDVVDDIFNQLDDLKNVYNLSEESVQGLKDIYDALEKVNQDYAALTEQINQHNFAYSKMLTELENLTATLANLEDHLDTSLDTLGNMREDEVRARQQLEEIKVVLKEAKLKIREYNLPVIPQSYYVELNEASSAIREIVKELEKKPITISVLNTRVDTARDLVLKLYSKTRELLRTAAFAETVIVYGNRYRSSYEGLSNKLNLAEQLFLKGEYQRSLELTINLLNKIEPGIYKRLLNMYKPENGEE